jgi:hypothetical protein
MKESILIKYGNTILFGLWAVLTVWLLIYMDRHNIKVGYVGSFLYGIGMGGLFIAIRDISICIWAIAGRPLIKRRDRKRVEKVISELKYGKRLATLKREELAKSTEKSLLENPTEEQQKYYIDLYLKMDEVFEKAEKVYNAQIHVHKMEIEHFYS